MNYDIPSRNLDDGTARERAGLIVKVDDSAIALEGLEVGVAPALQTDGVGGAGAQAREGPSESWVRRAKKRD